MAEARLLESVTERDVDLLFLEEFHVSETFNTWFAEEVFGESSRGLKFASAEHSVSDSALGESDILVKYVSDRDVITAILLEDKIDAVAQPDQAVRYAERGRKGQASGEWSRFATAIVAPGRYLGRGGDASRFDVQISYEKIIQWLLHNETDSHRGAYKARVLALAIQKRPPSDPPPMDERVTRFYRRYWEIARSEFPELDMKEPSDKSANSNWVGFRPKGIAKDRQINHKMDLGRVDLEVGGAAALVETWRSRYASHLASDTTIEVAGKSAAIRIPVPVLRLIEPFEEQIDAVRAGLRAAFRLYYQSRFIGGA